MNSQNIPKNENKEDKKGFAASEIIFTSRRIKNIKSFSSQIKNMLKICIFAIYFCQYFWCEFQDFAFSKTPNQNFITLPEKILFPFLKKIYSLTPWKNCQTAKPNWIPKISILRLDWPQFSQETSRALELITPKGCFFFRKYNLFFKFSKFFGIFLLWRLVDLKNESHSLKIGHL